MDNIGALKVGYNIVSKEASEKWLTTNWYELHHLKK
jgi:hypothetical protein